MTLILTVDYELFGNGSGSVSGCVLDPTRRILEIAESHGAPVTLFVEALEFDVMRNADAKVPRRAWAAVRDQLRSAVSRGHDVQFHLHPQWAGAQFEDGAWRLNPSRWRLGDLTASEIEELIGRGCRLLEEVVCPVRKDYRPRAFRAGGWCIQPSRATLEALELHGLDVDSSVAPGLHLADPSRWYDFRRAPARRSWWPVRDDVTSPDRCGPILEIPIAVGSVSSLSTLTRMVRSRIASSGQFPSGCEGTYESPRGAWGQIRAGISRLVDVRRAMLDFCRLPASTLVKVSREWLRSRNQDGSDMPIVAVGHCKNFGDDAAEQLDQFLGTVARGSDVNFGTFAPWFNRVEKSPECPR